MSKVLIVSPSFPFPEHKDGLAKINHNILMHQDGYSADLLCINDSSVDKKYPCTTYLIPLREKRKKTFYAIKWLFSSRPHNVIKIAPYIREITSRLEQVHYKYDVIHLSSPSMALVVSAASKSLRDKLLLFPVDSMALHTRRKIKRERFIKKIVFTIDYFKWLNFESYYYGLFKKVVFVSDVDSSFSRRVNEKIDAHTLPNGVDQYFFKSNGGKPFFQGQYSIIFTGDMSYAPNLDAATFIIQEVLPILLEKIDVKVYLVGQRPPKYLKDLSSENVVVTGFVEDIRCYIDGCHLYVSPLRFGSGIKNKVLEAMSMSKVVLATDISIEGINAENGKHYILLPQNAREACDTIAEVLLRLDDYSHIASSARKLIESSYSWERVCNQYGELYESSIGN